MPKALDRRRRLGSPERLGVQAPYYRRLSSNAQIRAFVDGVTAAAAGAIAGSGFVLGKRAIVDIPTAAIALATLGLLVWARRLPEPLLVLAAGAVGIALRGVS